MIWIPKVGSDFVEICFNVFRDERNFGIAIVTQKRAQNFMEERQLFSG